MSWIKNVYNSDENLFKDNHHKTNSINAHNSKNSIIIKGSITKVLFPKNKSDFNGWAKIVIDNKVVLCGKVISLDMFYDYSLLCTKLSESDQECQDAKHKSIGKYVKYTRFDKPLEIIRTLYIKRKPFGKELLSNMMSKLLDYDKMLIKSNIQTLMNHIEFFGGEIVKSKCQISENQRINIINNIFSKYEWFTLLCMETTYFYGIYFEDLVKAYGHSKRYKLMRLTPKEMADLIKVSRNSPQNLCIKSKFYLADKIGELSLKGMTYLQSITNCSFIRDEDNIIGNSKSMKFDNNTIIASIKVYNILKDQTKSKGDTIYFTKYIPLLRNSTIQYLCHQGLLIRDKKMNLCLSDTLSRVKSISLFIKKVIDQSDYISNTPISNITSDNIDDDNNDDNDNIRDPLPSNKKRKCVNDNHNHTSKNTRGVPGNNEIELDEFQQRAYDMSFSCPFLVITGKPGRGKTQLLYRIVKSHPPRTFLLLSPTGMAAVRIKELTKINARTIDIAILDIKNEKLSPSSFNGIIIDEFSMVNEKKLSKLFDMLNSMKFCISKLIFVGDSDQLSPIGYGYPMRDIEKKYPKYVCKLEKNHRVDPRFMRISSLWDNILNGDPNITLCTGLQNVRSDNNNIKSSIIDNSCVLIKRTNRDISVDTMKILDQMSERDIDNMQIISHRRVTCDKVNSVYFNKKYGSNIISSSKRYQFKKGQKIIFLKNVYNNESAERSIGIITSQVSNGEIDVIEKIIYYRCPVGLGKRKRGLQIEEIEIDTNLCQIPPYNPKTESKWRLAFIMKGSKKMVDVEFIKEYNISDATCITGSKSQGSQYDTALILIDSEYINGEYKLSDHFSKTLLYTMVSRAKKKVIILCNYNNVNNTDNDEDINIQDCSNNELAYIIKNNSERERDRNLYYYLHD